MSIPEFAPKYCINCGEKAPPDYCKDWWDKFEIDKSHTWFFICRECSQLPEGDKE